MDGDTDPAQLCQALARRARNAGAEVYRNAPAHAGSSLMQGNKVVGTVTSADWGHRVGINLAYAFVEPQVVSVGSMMQLDMYGDLVAVEVMAQSPYDPEFDLMRC